ncbi:MAG: tryptophan--tRNA ligase [Azovibrio sp.]|nr:tryptophan--tRNA ligase [Azovibrio sp.]
MYAERVLSGMRPTGALHLGHYHGVLANWVKLQHEYPCLFFVADWHALTTQYDDPRQIHQNSMDMIVDWLAAGVDPERATIFIQSHVPEHAELHLLLSMMTPLGWLERVPTYKDQQEKLANKDLSTYGFLGYPLLMSADILIYRADKVPVGEDQIPHVEFTRELARRFNHMYGREPGFAEQVEAALARLNSKARRSYKDLRTRFQQDGDRSAVEKGRALLREAGLALEDQERLLGHLEGTGRTLLVEPGYLLTEASKMPGLDGQKMSKSYGNTISLRESADAVAKKVRAMPTDPARVRRTDPGEPARCPVWQLHQVYSDDACKTWVQEGCRSAGIGCLDCKQPVIDGILKELAPMQARARHYQEDPERVRKIVAEGCDKARELARETMRDVRAAMGLDYR